jgi:sterol 14alpha-demethylase
MELLDKNGTSPLALMLPRLPIPQNRRCEQCRQRLLGMIQELMKQRGLDKPQSQPSKPAAEMDMLDQYARARLSDGSPLPPDMLLTTLIALFFGAHHNVTNTIMWLTGVLAEPRYADVLDKLRTEQLLLASEYRLRTPGEPVDEHSVARHARWLGQCMQETSRLYFTVMVPPRRARRSIDCQGVEIPKGSYVSICPLLQHHDARTYPQPEVFNPSRFDAPDASERAALETNPFGYDYVQFGYGRHMCTGAMYARYFIRTVVGRLFRDYDVHLAGESTAVPAPLFDKTIGTASPSKPIWVTVRRRAPTSAS